MKIWCLFSIANEYDQPDYNLEAWWKDKPTHKNIVCDAFEYSETSCPVWSDPKVGAYLKVKALLAGEQVCVGDCSYYLKEVSEGKVKDNEEE